MTTLIISNKETDDIMKIFRSCKDAALFIKGTSKTVENEVKEQRGGFLGILAATSDVSFLGNMLKGKGVI